MESIVMQTQKYKFKGQDVCFVLSGKRQSRKQANKNTNNIVKMDHIDI